MNDTKGVTHELLDVLVNRILAFEDSIAKYIKDDSSNVYISEWKGAMQLSSWIINAFDDTFEKFLDDDENKRAKLDVIIRKSTRIYRHMDGECEYPDIKAYLSLLSDITQFYRDVTDVIIDEFMDRHSGSTDSLVSSVKARAKSRGSMRSIELVLTTKDALDMMYVYLQRYKTIT